MATSSVPLGMTNAKGAMQPGMMPQATGTVGNGTMVPTSTATVAANPFAAPGATTPGIGTVPTTNTTGVQSNDVNWADGSHTVTGDLKDTYGAGTGTAISSVLQNMGTNTDAAVQATTANANLNLNNQLANQQAGFAAAGITPNSSAAALGASDLTASVDTSLNSTIAGMESQEEDTLLSTLTGEGAAHGTDESTMDSIMNGFTDAGTIAQSVTGLMGL